MPVFVFANVLFALDRQDFVSKICHIELINRVQPTV